MSRITSANLIERFGPRGMAAWRWLTSHRRRPPHREEGPSTPIRRRPSVDFSLTGLIYCAMMLFMGLAAINSEANLLFGVFGLMIGILLISATICRLMLAGLKVERVIPEYAAVGHSATIQYDFRQSQATVAKLVGGTGGTGRRGGVHAAAAGIRAARRPGQIGERADHGRSQAARIAQAYEFSNQHELPVRVRQAGDDRPGGRHDVDLSRAWEWSARGCCRCAARRNAAGRT